jgi:deazaflavin-dependent oxidoreductase (nitroreductase family)
MTWLGRRTLNPIVRGLFAVGLPLPWTAVLETVGRRTGRRRRTPVTARRRGDVVWFVSEHGRHAGYMRNIEANPQVRLRLGRRWVTGTARGVPASDPVGRFVEVARFPLGRGAYAATLRVLGTDPALVRVDLDR